MFTDIDLHASLLNALVKLNFNEATEVQARTLPIALSGKDLLVSSETGSGKTMAYLLPVLQQLLSTEVEQPTTRALVLTPTRELARQVLKQAKKLTSELPLHVGVIMGGEAMDYQQEVLTRQPDILIATPGRLLEHLSQNKDILSNIRYLVLDEADRMLDMGFRDDVQRITQACPAKRQTALFSATIEHRELERLVGKVSRDPEQIVIGASRRSYSHIRQQIALCDDDVKHKQKVLRWLLENVPYQKAVVFANKRSRVTEVASFLHFHQFACNALHGDMDTISRKQATDRFASDKVNILIATDIAARGLDVANVDLVINLDVPHRGDDYVHRIGRSGRAGEQGHAITLVNTHEWNTMSSIERYLRLTLERLSLPDSLKSSFSGPKKPKKSAEKKAKDNKQSKKKRSKVRHRDQKNIGKRRKPSVRPQEDQDKDQEAGE